MHARLVIFVRVGIGRSCVLGGTCGLRYMRKKSYIEACVNRKMKRMRGKYFLLLRCRLTSCIGACVAACHHSSLGLGKIPHPTLAHDTSAHSIHAHRWDKLTAFENNFNRKIDIRKSS